MATAPEIKSIPELHSGDHMSREEFHAIYEQTPEDFRAELIGGIVYVASPLKRRHGTNHLPLGSLLVTYESHTPGVESADNTTVLLGHECEPQPDLLLRILPEFGGQSGTTVDDYIKGPPELIIEIAHSSQAIDLHSKYDDYARHGVIEYIVVCLRDETVRWFDLKSDTELQPEKDGVIRVQTFPGLWINPTALLARDQAKLMQTLKQGLDSPEHSEFVQRLESQCFSEEESSTSETLFPAEQLLHSDHVSEADPDVRDQFTDWVRLVLQVCPECLAKRRSGVDWIFIPPEKSGEPTNKNLCTVWLRKSGLQIRVNRSDSNKYYSSELKDRYLTDLSMRLEELLQP